MLIQLNKKDITIKKVSDKNYISDMLFMKLSDINIFEETEQDILNKIENAPIDKNGQITIFCKNPKFLDFLNQSNINYTILEK